MQVKRRITPSELNWGEVYFVKKWDPQSDSMELVLTVRDLDDEVVKKESVVVYPVEHDYAKALILLVVGKAIARKLAGILSVLEDYFFPIDSEEKEKTPQLHNNEEPLL